MVAMIVFNIMIIIELMGIPQLRIFYGIYPFEYWCVSMINLGISFSRIPFLDKAYMLRISDVKKFGVGVENFRCPNLGTTRGCGGAWPTTTTIQPDTPEDQGKATGGDKGFRFHQNGQLA